MWMFPTTAGVGSRGIVYASFSGKQPGRSMPLTSADGSSERKDRSMPNAGDRVIVEGTRVGAARRAGLVLEIAGTLIKVRWTDGSESLFSPGSGAVRFEPSNGSDATTTTGSGTKRAKAAAKATGKTKNKKR